MAGHFGPLAFNEPPDAQTAPAPVTPTPIVVTTDAYLARVPPEHVGDANFMAELAAILQPFADAQTFLLALPQAFDLDSAIGVQLDATGAWAGTQRRIPVPLINPWFAFDTNGLGFDEGYWLGSYNGLSAQDLDDDTFRRLIRAVILANNSNGLREDILASLEEYFSTSPDVHVFVIDATDYVLNPPGTGAVSLRMVVGISGKIPSQVDLAILDQLLIPFKPAAVALDWAVTTAGGTPVFGFDVLPVPPNAVGNRGNSFIAGFDIGAWGASPGFVASWVATVNSVMLAIVEPADNPIFVVKGSTTGPLAIVEPADAPVLAGAAIFNSGPLTIIEAGDTASLLGRAAYERGQGPLMGPLGSAPLADIRAN